MLSVLHHEGELYTVPQSYECLMLHIISFTSRNNPFPAITKLETGSNLKQEVEPIALLRLASTPDAKHAIVESHTTVFKLTRHQLS